MVAALRQQFGGHAVESAKGADAPGADTTPPGSAADSYPT
jgi:6-phosphogluconate dehydrogenase